MTGIFDGMNEFSWNAIVSQKSLKNTSLQAIKSLLKVNKIDVERSIPLNRLLLNYYPN